MCAPGKPHFLCYLLADGCVLLALHRVADSVSVIVNDIYHNVTMRVVRSVMTGDKELRILISHSLLSVSSLIKRKMCH